MNHEILNALADDLEAEMDVQQDLNDEFTTEDE